MDLYKAFGRGILALIIVITLSVPSFARAMSMQTSQAQANMSVMVGCHGQPCSDHQSNSPVQNKAATCMTAFCIAPLLLAPNPVAVFSTVSYPIVHRVIAATFPLGMSQNPDPYPPRQNHLI
ncbi:hypothetical protein [Acidocella sp. KAb 2-4]|jgi:hypothetical protein|uniref:hypothetical protein n=1 Tax=Acidocella sp. KAb 2-4 TaxID=2885158 RepID=UPI001D069D9D|nr:hypothetical protein [Acidocella sp. KAb 2-4]MCB5945167.1 hypothetical protein [Acidocella sp. KAb 2-4]